MYCRFPHWRWLCLDSAAVWIGWLALVCLAAGSVCIGNNRPELHSVIRSLVFVISLAVVVSISVILVAVPKSSDAEIRQKIADEETRVCDAQTYSPPTLPLAAVLLCFVYNLWDLPFNALPSVARAAILCCASERCLCPLPTARPAAAALVHLCTVRTVCALAGVQ